MVSGSKDQRVPPGLDLLPECKWLPFGAHPQAADVVPLAGLSCPGPAPLPNLLSPSVKSQGSPCSTQFGVSLVSCSRAFFWFSQLKRAHMGACACPRSHTTWDLGSLYLAMPSPIMALTTHSWPGFLLPKATLQVSAPTFLSPGGIRGRAEPGMSPSLLTPALGGTTPHPGGLEPSRFVMVVPEASLIALSSPHKCILVG